MQKSPFDIHNTNEVGTASNNENVSTELTTIHSTPNTSLSGYLTINNIQVSLLDVCKNPPTTDIQIYKDIVANIPEINDKIRLFCRPTSQTCRRLITPIMLNASNTPYRTLKQILAQIEDVKGKVIGFLTQESDINNTIKDSINAINPNSQDFDVYNKQQLALYRQYPYLESSLRELYSLIQAYYEIKKNKNIPDDWDELDFEKEEIKGNLGLGFRNGIKDVIQTGRISGSTMELFEGLGVSPFEAFSEINAFVSACPAIPYTYEQYNAFIDKMVEKYQSAHLKALQRLGLDSNYLDKATSSCKQLS